MKEDERKKTGMQGTKNNEAVPESAEASARAHIEEASAAPVDLAGTAAAGEEEAPFAHTSAAEAELARYLAEGPFESEDPAEEAVAKLSPRWEIRVQSTFDPVAEETARYRKMAKEVDDRYGEDA
ncbi:hypothetical protein [Cohnella thermotolerans]|uniref:hypothetical protein n=1 Tax=Cohnella thermotolerans TaxID=329858 RepID=UPI000415C610|nr:hypothetical protein [Cohnella thermotolerans]